MTTARDLQIALYVYNLGITRSREEYRLRPTAVCAGWMKGPGHKWMPCDSLALTGDRYCRACRVQANRKNQHERGRRAARKATK